eukprot:gene19349-21268_t
MEDMPVTYWDTSYFTLDPYCAVTNNNERDNEHDSSYEFKNISMPSNSNDIEVEDVTSLPNPVPCDITDLIIPPSFAKGSTGASCCDTLDQLKSMIFNIIRQKSLDELQKKLQVLLNETKELTEEEHNLVIEKNTTKIENKEKNICSTLQVFSKRNCSAEYFDNDIDVELYAVTDEMRLPDMNQTHPVILDSGSDGDTYGGF